MQSSLCPYSLILLFWDHRAIIFQLSGFSRKSILHFWKDQEPRGASLHGRNGAAHFPGAHRIGEGPGCSMARFRAPLSEKPRGSK